jgi:mRNA interferase YafQ
VKIQYTTQFKKDYQRIKKQNKKIKKLEKVIQILFAENQLPLRYRDHQLQGKWKKYRDCHIEPDWILIYKISPHELILERTGSHSELF